uniref:Uncharacterized protein n=1 Tax=Myoviridae sp. ctYA416 TaxID=2825125 RepID=A0A8S5UTU3_9CAUD|nr:MAG TPA: hypothetical protein [Myoviridae sp. ctYA416]
MEYSLPRPPINFKIITLMFLKRSGIGLVSY